MKPRDYCCCAIPLVNIGIYATLIEQLALGVIAGTLAIGTPDIVGAATPSFAPALFAIVCYVAAGIQVLGLWGVAKERPGLFRRYVQLHIIANVAVFAIGAAWAIVSATRHSTAQAKCVTKFFPDQTPSNASEGNTMCEIFPWVDVGIMGGLWVLLAIFQIYFFVVVSSYSAVQRDDHRKFDTEYDATNPLTNSIPLADRSDPWDSRPSVDETPYAPPAGAAYGGPAASSYGHVRQASSGSAVTASPGGASPVRARSSRAFQGYALHDPGFVAQPPDAYTQEPGPTPVGTHEYYSGHEGVDRPEQIVYHPAEGSFGRKTPRESPVDQYQNPYYDRR